MLGDTDRYDDIDRYVTDQMTPNERESFVQDIESDPSLRARVHLVEDIKDGLVRRQEKIDQIKKWQQEGVGEKRKSATILKISTISVAAAIMIGAFISYPTSYHGLQDHAFETEMQSLLRSSDDFNLISYWDSKEYEVCLSAIRNEIESYEKTIDTLDPAILPEEEYKGMLELYSMQIDNLKWANIQTLLKMRKYEDALLDVERYMSEGGARSEEAFKLHKRLLRKISR